MAMEHSTTGLSVVSGAKKPLGSTKLKTLLDASLNQSKQNLLDETDQTEDNLLQIR
jgi:hypothetical protein